MTQTPVKPTGTTFAPRLRKRVDFYKIDGENYYMDFSRPTGLGGGIAKVPALMQAAEQ